MRPNIFELLFNDDRMFVLEISWVTSSELISSAPEKQEWAVITRRNVLDYQPHRTDTFPTRIKAVEYYKDVVTETPRVSLGNESPVPPPTLESYTSWLMSEHLYDPILNPGAPISARSRSGRRPS
jgi:hypothetical protein